jgi:hypothetical protein
LRPRRERPSDPRAAEKGDEVATSRSHSITSSARAERKRHRKAECACGLQVDDHLNLGGLLNWQVGWLLASENPTAVETSQSARIKEITPVARQAAGCGKFGELVDRGHGIPDA